MYVNIPVFRFVTKRWVILLFLGNLLGSNHQFVIGWVGSWTCRAVSKVSSDWVDASLAVDFELYGLLID